MSVLTNWGGTATSWDAAAQGAGFMHTDDYMKSTNWLGISKADNPFSKGNLTGLFSKEGLGNMVKGALPSIGLGVAQMGVNMLAGQNHSAVGDVMQTVGGLASNIPGVGGLIGAGVGVVGGLVNAAFGSHINEEFVNQTRNQANQIGSNVFNANTNADLLNDWGNLTEQSSVRKSEVGSDGWFSSKASRKTAELNRLIAEANRRQLANFNVAAENVDTQNDFRIMQNMAAYGGPIGSFRRFYANGGSLFDTPQFFSAEPQTYDKGGYLNQAKALIRENEGWSAKPYADSPKGKNWRSVGYGFNDSGFRDKYPEGISKRYEHGITKKQAEEELDYFLNKAEKQLKSIYGKQWNDFTDSQKAAILDTYYQRPASVAKGSRFYKAVTSGEDAGKYLGVAGYNKRNKVRQGVFGGGYSGYVDWSNTESDSNPSTLQEVTSFTPVVHDLDLSGITPTQAKALELNLTSPTFDLSMFGKPMTAPTQQAVPTVGTVEDFLASYGDFEENLFEDGGKLNVKDMNIFDFGGGLTHGSDWDTGINWVNEGGSHGENPLGGVQMGVDEQGVPNLVEEGEAIWNGDYVFSKRMKVPKKLAKKYGLGGDMTFADAIAKLTKDSEERPLSNIDRATNDHILGEFADSQEELRMAKAQRAMDKEIQLQDDFLTGFQFGLGGHMSPLGIVPDADNISPFEKVEQLYADGGGIHIDPSKKGTFKAQASKMGMGVQEAASHILANKEDYSPAMVKKAVFAHNFAHADGGSLFTDPFEPNVFAKGGSKSKKKASNRGKVVSFSYDWYRNGSDGYSTPTGFKVGKNGRAYDYTKEYTDLVNKLGADDIRKWAAEHPDDSSLKSFLAKGNDLSKLTDEQWRIGATDGKYGFMHHVADQISKEKDRVPADFNWEQEAPWLFGNIVAPETAKPNPMAEIARDKSTPTRSVSVTDNGTNFGVVDTPQAITRSGITDTTSGDVDGITRSPFKPKQTWTRYAPIAMNALFGLKEMLTPADYGNADAITAAAYQAGSPVSIGTEYIGDYRKRDPFDETYLMNIINQNSRAANRNFMNISGGNRAAAMSGILANDLVTQMSLAEAARKAYLANRADDADVAAFNKDTNKYNATAQNTRNLSLAQLNSQRQNAMLSGIAQGARLRQAIKDQRDAAISANLTAFAQGLGDLGKENGYYNMLGGLNEEGVLKYFYGDDWKTKFNNVNV